MHKKIPNKSLGFIVKIYNISEKVNNDFHVLEK